MPSAEVFRNENTHFRIVKSGSPLFSQGEKDRLSELQKELMDLKIANWGKDYFIEQLQKERESFANERQGYVEKLMTFNHWVGALESKLLQLEPAQNRRTE